MLMNNDPSMRYTVTIGDKAFADLRLSGNNFISKKEITENDFGGSTFSKVEISDGINTKVLTNCELVQIVHYSDGYYFIIRELTPDEIARNKLRADVDFIALMTDTELE